MKRLTGNIQASGRIRRILSFKLLLVLFSVFDLIRTFIQVQVSASEAFDAGVDLFWTPMFIHRWGDSLLFVLSAFGLWLNKPWSYFLSLASGGWLLYRGYRKWGTIAEVSFPELPMWSQATLRTWFIYENGQWEFPRLLLGMLVVTWATGLLLRQNSPGSAIEKKAA